MIVTLLRAWLALTAGELDVEVRVEVAHRACETAVYAALAPDATDDATTPLGELACEMLCRNEALGAP